MFLVRLLCYLRLKSRQSVSINANKTRKHFGRNTHLWRAYVSTMFHSFPYHTNSLSSSRKGGHIHIHKTERKSQIKYLGVFIDQNLHWGPQIQHINNKLMKNVGIINKLLYYVDLHTLKQLYYSFIYPYLTYGITSWGIACKSRIQKIKSKQNRCVRSIFFAHSRDSAMYYLNLLEILTLENIYKF